jgi:hypothetical protein
MRRKERPADEAKICLRCVWVPFAVVCRMMVMAESYDFQQRSALLLGAGLDAKKIVPLALPEVQALQKILRA